MVTLALARSKSRRHTRRKGVEKADLLEAAVAAQLRYVSDAGPGIRRHRRGKGFRYLDAEGHPVRDLTTLRGIIRLLEARS